MNHTVPYDQLSEASGVPIADEAATMMVTRYRFGAELSVGRRTLELACSSGPGLRWLSRESPLTVGGDINSKMLQRAGKHYSATMPLAQLSAMQLPFADGSFDLVLLLEASYYIPQFEVSLAEIRRVLAPGGIVYLANANPERPDFIRSPFSHHYHTADEFRTTLTAAGFAVRTWVAFPVDAPADDTAASRIKKSIIKLARQVLEGLGLIPNTLEGRAKLKRLMGQRLRQMPGEIDSSFAVAAPMLEVGSGPQQGHKVIYVTGQLP